MVQNDILDHRSSKFEAARSPQSNYKYSLAYGHLHCRRPLKAFRARRFFRPWDRPEIHGQIARSSSAANLSLRVPNWDGGNISRRGLMGENGTTSWLTDRALVRIASRYLSADIDPQGAQLFALRDCDGQELQWNGNPEIWKGRAPSP